MKLARWYLLTGEYPPDAGGVADYTENLARGLAQEGEAVTVLAPAGERTAREEWREGVRIVWLPGHFGWRGQRALQRFLVNEPAGGRVLLQYVPHAFGWKAMNLPFIERLARQRRHALWVMFHEVAYPVETGQRWRHRLLAEVTRWMAGRVVAAAERVMVSTTAWDPLLHSICGKAVATDWLPIPSNFEGNGPMEPSVREGTAAGTSGGELVIGHFGTFGKFYTEPLAAIIPAILDRCPEVTMRLIGRGSVEFSQQLTRDGGCNRSRMQATGELAPAAVATSIHSCDLLIQPYPDGVSTRRTSAMAGLALGRPLLSQAGALTESLWRESGAVRLLDDVNPADWARTVRELIDIPAERVRLGTAGADLYRRRFSWARTLEQLRGWDASEKTAGRACAIGDGQPLESFGLRQQR